MRESEAAAVAEEGRESEKKRRARREMEIRVLVN